jgi:hypothetical protein
MMDLYIHYSRVFMALYLINFAQRQPYLLYFYPPLIGQQAQGIKMSTITWNLSELVVCIKIKSV